MQQYLWFVFHTEHQVTGHRVEADKVRRKEVLDSGIALRGYLKKKAVHCNHETRGSIYFVTLPS
jgi:hypothetical protein